MLIRVSNKTTIYSPKMVQTRVRYSDSISALQGRTQSQSWFISEISNKIIKEVYRSVTKTISHMPWKMK